MYKILLESRLSYTVQPHLVIKNEIWIMAWIFYHKHVRSSAIKNFTVFVHTINRQITDSLIPLYYWTMVGIETKLFEKLWVFVVLERINLMCVVHDMFMHSCWRCFEKYFSFNKQEKLRKVNLRHNITALRFSSPWSLLRSRVNSSFIQWMEATNTQITTRFPNKTSNV